MHPLLLQYLTRFDQFSIFTLDLFVSKCNLNVFSYFFVILYLHNKEHDMWNTFATEFISEVSRSIIITCGMFYESFNVLRHISKSSCNIILYFTFPKHKANWISHICRSNTNNFKKKNHVLVGLIRRTNWQYHGKCVKQIDETWMSLEYMTNIFSILACSISRYIMILIQQFCAGQKVQVCMVSYLKICPTIFPFIWFIILGSSAYS